MSVAYMYLKLTTELNGTANQRTRERNALQFTARYKILVSN